MFINLFSVSDPHATVNCGSVWTCQALIRAHVAGFSRILTFRRVCVCVFQCQSPHCCVFIMCTWFEVHLLLRPAKKHLDVADRIASHSVPLDETRGTRSSDLSHQRPPAFQKGRFCYVTKPRASWKTHCCSQSCS